MPVKNPVAVQPVVFRARLVEAETPDGDSLTIIEIGRWQNPKHGAKGESAGHTSFGDAVLFASGLTECLADMIIKDPTAREQMRQITEAQGDFVSQRIMQEVENLAASRKAGTICSEHGVNLADDRECPLCPKQLTGG